MTLTYRTCSNCLFWFDDKTLLEGVVAAMCEKSNNITKGSFSCSKWKKIKHRIVYNAMRDELIKVRDTE